MICHKQAIENRLFACRVRKRWMRCYRQRYIGSVTASVPTEAVVTIHRPPNRPQATAGSHNEHMSRSIPEAKPSSIHTDATSKGLSARPWSLAEAPTDSNGTVFGWRTGFSMATPHAAAGVVPLCYRADEGQLYVLLSIQKSDRGSKSMVYTFLGGKVAGPDSNDARRTAAREAHEETHRVLNKRRVLDALLGRVPAYGIDPPSAEAAPAGAAGVAVEEPDAAVATAAAAAANVSASFTTAPPGHVSAAASSAVDAAAATTTTAAGAAASTGLAPEPAAAGSSGSIRAVSNTSLAYAARGGGVNSSDSQDGSSSDTSSSSSRSGAQSGGGLHPVPYAYFASGRYTAFVMHLPDAWHLPAEFAAKIRAGKKHQEAAKAEGLEWVSVADMERLRAGEALHDPVTGRAVRGHHYFLMLLRAKRDGVGVLTWLQRLQAHIRAWHGHGHGHGRERGGADDLDAVGRSRGGCRARAAGDNAALAERVSEAELEGARIEGRCEERPVAHSSGSGAAAGGSAGPAPAAGGSPADVAGADYELPGRFATCTIRTAPAAADSAAAQREHCSDSSTSGPVVTGRRGNGGGDAAGSSNSSCSATKEFPAVVKPQRPLYQHWSLGGSCTAMTAEPKPLPSLLQLQPSCAPAGPADRRGWTPDSHAAAAQATARRGDPAGKGGSHARETKDGVGEASPDTRAGEPHVQQLRLEQQQQQQGASPCGCVSEGDPPFASAASSSAGAAAVNPQPQARSKPPHPHSSFNTFTHWREDGSFEADRPLASRPPSALLRQQQQQPPRQPHVRVQEPRRPPPPMLPLPQPSSAFSPRPQPPQAVPRPSPPQQQQQQQQQAAPGWVPAQAHRSRVQAEEAGSDGAAGALQVAAGQAAPAAWCSGEGGLGDAPFVEDSSDDTGGGSRVVHRFVLHRTAADRRTAA